MDFSNNVLKNIEYRSYRQSADVRIIHESTVSYALHYNLLAAIHFTLANIREGKSWCSKREIGYQIPARSFVDEKEKLMEKYRFNTRAHTIDPARSSLRLEKWSVDRQSPFRQEIFSSFSSFPN